ncbi:MAG: hypothetical protein AABZ53_11780 [Planctomycetota bacterium]
MESKQSTNLPLSQIVRAKLEGSVEAMERLSREERGLQARETLGNDYNATRKFISDGFPHLTAYLPPEAEVQESTRGDKGWTAQRYSELLVFCRQMLHLMNLQVRSES